MPRRVRNFWLELEVDGKLTRVETGPRGKGGGFRLRVFMRDKGHVWEAANLNGRVEGDGLRLSYVPDGHVTLGPGGATIIQTER